MIQVRTVTTIYAQVRIRTTDYKQQTELGLYMYPQKYPHIYILTALNFINRYILQYIILSIYYAFLV
jgi:hypothetical protein